jgi:hypothetical protein
MTYNFKGQKSTQTEKSGWDKRQATVLLTVNGNGCQEQVVIPLLIFKGEAGGSILKEKDRYRPRVLVEFNEKAWCKGTLFLQWVQQELLEIMKPTAIDPVLLVMDCVAFRKTPEVLETLRQNHCQVAMIPPGCTGILQPLDTHINKPFKAILTELVEEDTQRKVDENPRFKWTSSLKPIISDYSQTDAEIEAYQQAHVKIPEIGENGEYTRRWHPSASIQLAEQLSAQRSLTGSRNTRDWQGEDDPGFDGRRFDSSPRLLRTRF